MEHREFGGEAKPVAWFALVGAGAVSVMLGLVVLAGPRQASALATYTQQTHLACGLCHVNSAGGGKLTSFGAAFAANGHKLPSARKSTAKETAKTSKTAKTAKTGEPSAAPATSEIVAPSPDYATAHAWSLRAPYYSHFLYDHCDYNDCR
jgi:hypothetical protein